MDKIFFLPHVKSIIKIKPITIDNHVFRLHYRVTAVFLAVASLMVSATQFFGNPIKCVLPPPFPRYFPVKVIETYCWVESTFTIPKLLDKKVGHEVPYPGVGKHIPGQDERTVHAYYQWVCVVLFIQALLFFVPHLLWKGWEGGKISSLLMGLDKLTDPKSRKIKCSAVSRYILDRTNRSHDYFLKFFISEILNFVNVVGQIFLMDKFLHGEFTTYGHEVFQFMLADQDDRVDPMIRVFPRMTKCTFHHFGPSGDVQRLDTFCVLPLNILNEKIYVFLWFWFVLLSIITGLALIYRLVMILSSRARFIVTTSVNYFTSENSLAVVLHNVDFGDWFLLYMLGNNMENFHFKELIDEMADEINKMQNSEQTLSDESYETNV